MTAALAVAPAIPLGQSGKFVAGAYIVFLALILVYVAIMAVRSQRIERELSELQRDVDEARVQREDREQEEAVL
jgi:hypothetical protein